MKKIVRSLLIISAVVFAIAWGVMGLKLLDKDYLITAEAYTGLISIIVGFGCLLYLKCLNRCPHCGKTIQSFGKYCSYCGKKINEQDPA